MRTLSPIVMPKYTLYVDYIYFVLYGFWPDFTKPSQNVPK